MAYLGKDEPLPVENPCASCEVLEDRVKELEEALAMALKFRPLPHKGGEYPEFQAALDLLKGSPDKAGDTQ